MLLPSAFVGWRDAKKSEKSFTPTLPYAQSQTESGLLSRNDLHLYLHEYTHANHIHEVMVHSLLPSEAICMNDYTTLSFPCGNCSINKYFCCFHRSKSSLQSGHTQHSGCAHCYYNCCNTHCDKSSTERPW